MSSKTGWQWFYFAVQLVCVGILVGALVYLVSAPINLSTADLGRHIKNGELVWQALTTHGSWDVLYTNTYSYTQADFSVINHHYLSGLLFFALFSLGGFTLLQVFYILLVVASFLLIFDIARRFSGFWPAIVLSCFALPLIAFRDEVRPEVISTFLFSFNLWLFTYVYIKDLSPRWLWLLPIVQVFWVNMHIYFILGFLVQGGFFLYSLVVYRWSKHTQQVLWVCLASLGASLINPFHIRLVLYPFTILKDYGYQIVENKSVWFLWKLHLVNPSYTLFAWLLGAIVVLMVGYVLLAGKRTHIAFVLVSVCITGLSMHAIRNFSLFGLVFMLVGTLFVSAFKQRFKGKLELPYQVAIALVLILAGVGLVIIPFRSKVQAITPGIGLASGVNRGGEFFVKNHLSGPVYNNYDIGGYLIYYLYPQQKVFVDNRPEAYSVDFLQNVYIKGEENELVWQQLDATYHFNSIFFDWHDLTPWAQSFLVRRVQDSNWIPVFVDDYTLIMLKNNQQNAAVIKTYELPRSMFGVTQSK